MTALQHKAMLLIALMALSLAFSVACGGDDDGPAPFAVGDDDSPDGDNADGNGVSAGGEPRASVTIGETTYEFMLDGSLTLGGTRYTGLCSVGVSAFGRGYTSDGVTLAFQIPPVDWENNEIFEEPPEIIVDGTDVIGGRWEANALFADNETVGKGNSQVDSWEFDGSTVRGTATYFAGIAGEKASGEFEIVCP